MIDIGVQVVCLADDWTLLVTVPTVKPRKDQVLTVREINKFDDGGIGLLFEELRNPIDPKWNSELHFDIGHFKPVKKTSIECFTDMLNKVDA
jgi:hypothetical protein